MNEINWKISKNLWIIFPPEEMYLNLRVVWNNRKQDDKRVL